MVLDNRLSGLLQRNDICKYITPLKERTAKLYFFCSKQRLWYIFPSFFRGPVTDCTGLAIKNFTCFSPSVNIWARHRLHGPVADFTGPSLHFQRPRPIFMVTGPRKNDGKLFEHVIGGTLEKSKRHVFCTHQGYLLKQKKTISQFL